jgi:hypothetical protein
LHRCGTPNDAVPKTVCVLQPDQFSSTEKGKRLQSLDRRPDPRNRLIDVVGAGIDDFDAEFSGIRRRQFRRQLRRGAFHLALIRADNGVDVRDGLFSLGPRHSEVFRMREERSQGWGEFELPCLGSARVSSGSCGASRQNNLSGKFAKARRLRQHARRVRYPGKEATGGLPRSCLATKFPNLSPHSREIFPQNPRQSRISPNKCEAARIRTADAGRAHPTA